MDGFNIHLSLGCKFCHVRDKKADTLMFDKDDKSEKEIARNMVRMTININKKYFHFNQTLTAVQVQAVNCTPATRTSQCPKKEKKIVNNSPINFKPN